MRAQVVHELSDDPGVMRLEDITLPPPGPGEVRVGVRAAAVNFPDLLMIRGAYQFKPPLPFVPGLEAAGVVLDTGADVTTCAVGDEVVAGARLGGFAEELNAPAASVRPRPAALDFAEAAACSVAYLTAYVALVRRGALASGETLLVHGAAGGAGLAAVDLGCLLGARVIATASTADKRRFLETRGPEHVIAAQDFRDPVMDITAGKGADVIYDPVGGSVLEQSVRCIAWNGRLLVVGFASGRIPSVPVNMPLIKGFSIVGVRAGEYGRRSPEDGVRNFAAIDRWLGDGSLRPHIGARFPLERAADAVRTLERRRIIGKAVLNVPGPQQT